MPDWYYVTGCDSGFGAECVRMLAAQGHNVFAGHFLEDSAAKLEADGKGKIVPVRLDVTSDESVAKAAKVIEEKMGKGGWLKGLVNNAGLLLQNGPNEWTPISSFQRMYDVNLLGTVRVTHSVLPLLRKCEGRIVNTASIAGRQGFSLQGAYCASKFAVEGYSESLRRDMKPWGVTVHIVEPGVFTGTALYSTYADGIRKLFDALPPAVQADYGKEYLEKLAGASNDQLVKLNNTDTSLVPKAYIHALTAKKPLYRYRVGKDSKFMITLVSWMHESWQDKFLTKPGFVPAASTLAAYYRTDARMVGWTVMRRLVFAIVAVLLWKLLKRRLQ
eukprot:TRINITY_DN24358_c0_g1_i1.p1 TRINITY_DN24358_c0_g1~~TRINITY_DN24358_c0_g1_i1.p1  ORF type:complete len:346 (+),score=110.61 TRINITY_DN24358_c0_g1_i1:46-1038(+)